MSKAFLASIMRVYRGTTWFLSFGNGLNDDEGPVGVEALLSKTELQSVLLLFKCGV